MNQEKNQRDMVELVGFLLSSAHGLFEEPKHYGPLRLVDAAGRLLKFSEDLGINDEFLSTLQTRIDEIRFGSASVDPEVLDAILDFYAEHVRSLDAS